MVHEAREVREELEERLIGARTHVTAAMHVERAQRAPGSARRREQRDALVRDAPETIN